ncbi:MAG: hypothetical protein AVDCRST_MAG68-57, partial [uncultured Gemmatimonadetes bacterium]
GAQQDDAHGAHAWLRHSFPQRSAGRHRAGGPRRFGHAAANTERARGGGARHPRVPHAQHPDAGRDRRRVAGDPVGRHRPLRRGQEAGPPPPGPGGADGRKLGAHRRGPRPRGNADVLGAALRGAGHARGVGRPAGRRLARPGRGGDDPGRILQGPRHPGRRAHRRAQDAEAGAGDLGSL